MIMRYVKSKADWWTNTAHYNRENHERSYSMVIFSQNEITDITVNSEIIAIFLLMQIMQQDVRRNNKNSHFNSFQ